MYLEKKTVHYFINVLKLEDFKQFCNALKSFSSVKLSKNQMMQLFPKTVKKFIRRS